MAYDNETTSVEISLDDLRADGIEESLKAMALAEVIPGGTYLAKLHNFKIFENDDGRQVISARFQLFSETGRQLKRISTKLSPHTRLTQWGKVDTMSKRYLALAAAVDADPTDPVDVIGTAQSVMVKINFQDAYAVKEDHLHAFHHDRTANDQGDVWVSLSGQSEEANGIRAHYLGAGYEPIYLVKNFYAE